MRAYKDVKTSDAAKLVVILEDEPPIATLLAGILAGVGYGVRCTDSAEDVLAIAAAERVDAFLLDVELPGTISGLECCRRLRKLPQHQDTPILIVTASEEGLLRSAFIAGANDFIQKPFMAETVKVRLQSHLQRFEYFRELQSVRQELERYVSVVTQIVAEKQAKAGHVMKPTQKDVTMLFTDIREFTSLSEKLDPEGLFEALNSHLGAQVQFVAEHGGYVDKFSGDGLMAVFDGTELAVQACICALRIRDHAQESPLGVPEMARTGIGLHFGTALVGTLGTALRRDYSAIGLSVNVAARLCGYAEAMTIVASEAVRKVTEGNSDVVFLRERRVHVRGLDEPLTVHALEWAARRLP